MQAVVVPALITDAVSRTETGVATGMNTVVRTVGSVIGSQVAVTLAATERIAGTGVPAESGFAAAPRRPRTEPEPARPAAGHAVYPSAS